MLLPVWFCGGLERYHLGLARSTGQSIEWVGCVLTDRAPTLQSMVDELAAVMPVYGTMQLADGSLNAMERIVRYGSEAEALNRVLPDCDALLTWGVRDLSMLNGFRKPVVLISHGGCDWTAGMLNLAATRATHFAAVSRAAARAFPRSVQNRVYLQPAGVELSRVKPSVDRAEARRRIGVNDDHVLVGYVGRFSPEKNPHRAAEIVGELGAPYVAVMHGAAVLADEVYRETARQKANGRVLFLDRSWHLGDVLAGLDCLIAASPSEGGPLAALEAWLAGLPLVSTDVGVVHDDAKFVNSVTRVLPVDAPIGDWVKATVEACGPEARARSEAAVPSMIARYGAEQMGLRWSRWLEKVVKGTA
jgi:glycosyltransferase involved in cell wall biosynthesis